MLEREFLSGEEDYVLIVRRERYKKLIRRVSGLNAILEALLEERNKEGEK